MESPTQSYKKPTMNKALSLGASQHFCDVHRSLFVPIILMGSLRLTWILPLCLSTSLKEAGAQRLREMLMPKNYLFAYQASYFKLSRTGPITHQTLLGAMFSSTKLHFAQGFLLKLLGRQTWLRILSVDSWPPVLGLLSVCLCFSLPQLNPLDYTLPDSFLLSWNTNPRMPPLLARLKTLEVRQDIRLSLGFELKYLERQARNGAFTIHLVLKESWKPMTLLFTL